MKCVKYEFYKLFGIRYLWVITLICLLSNMALCIYQTHRGDHQLPPSVIKSFFDTYSADPDTIKAEYEKTHELLTEQNKLIEAAIQRGEYDFELEKMQNKYAPDAYSDIQLFNEVFERQSYISNYKDTIQTIIDQAKHNINEYNLMGFAEDSYAVKYQKQVVERYSTVKDQVVLKFEYTCGWEEFFNYNAVNIFIFIIVLLLGSAIFTEDRKSGFLYIIRVSKYGRMETAIAKIIVMLGMTIFVVLLFSISTWAVYYIRLGFSNPANALQVLKNFILCPYIISIGEYALLSLIVKIISYQLFALTVLAISVFIYNIIVTCISGFGFWGLNLLLYMMVYLNSDNILKNLNIVAITEVSPLFIRYRAVNFFGEVITYLPLMLIFFSIVEFGLIFVTIWKYKQGTPPISISLNKAKYFGRYNLLNTTLKNRLPSNKNRQSYCMSLLYYEKYKTVIASKYILIIIILFATKIIVSEYTYQHPISYTDQIYHEYMSTLAGEQTEDKQQYLLSERKKIDTILSSREIMSEKYKNDEISLEDYRNYISDYNYAYSRNVHLARIESHAAYINQLADIGREAWFVYDTGWNMMFFMSFDWSLYAILLLLFTGTFASEYDSKSSANGFSRILHTTKYGRKKTFKSKYLSAVILTVLATVIWNIIDLCFIFTTYDLPQLHAPLCSIETFANFLLDITIYQYVVCYFFVKLLSSVMLSCFICSLSAIFHKHMAVMGIVIIITIFPGLLSYFGLSIFSKVDFTLFMRATPMLMQNNTALIYISICLLLCVITTIIAERVWNR